MNDSNGNRKSWFDELLAMLFGMDLAGMISHDGPGKILNDFDGNASKEHRPDLSLDTDWMHHHDVGE